MTKYGPIVVDDSSGKFQITSVGVPADVAKQIASDLAPVIVPPPVVTPPSTSVIAWKTIPHTLNDWSAAGQVSFGGKKWVVESSMKPYAAQFSTNTSSPIFRGEVRNNELWSSSDGGNDTERAELDGFPNSYPKGTEFWFSFQVMVEPGAKQITTAGGNPGEGLIWAALAQAHGNGNQAPVPWTLSFVGETLSVRTQTGANRKETTHYTQPKSVRGQVYSVVTRLKITGDTKSTMTCWIDGVQVCDVAGIAIGGADAMNYCKVGIYRGWEKTGYPPLAVQVANVEHGTASLLDRVAKPLPWPMVV